MRVTAPGPLFIHVPADREASWFSMMTAEVRKVIYRAGKWVTYWDKIRERNEGLDCRVYAWTALSYLRKARLVSAATAPGMALGPRPAPATTLDGEAPAEVVAAAPRPKKRIVNQPRSGFWGR